MLPVVWHEPQYVGRVGGALSAEDGRKAAEIACLSALSAARAYLGALDKITGVAKLGVLSLRSRADLSLVVSVAPTMCVGRSRRLTPPLRRRPLLLPDEALCQRSGPLEDQAGVCKRTSAGGGAALGRRTQWHQLQHRPQLRTGDRRRHCRVGRGGRRIRHECASLSAASHRLVSLGRVQRWNCDFPAAATTAAADPSEVAPPARVVRRDPGASRPGSPSSRPGCRERRRGFPSRPAIPLQRRRDG